MQLTIDRDAKQYRSANGMTLLPAKDGARRSYVVAITTPEWEALLRRYGEEAASEVGFLTFEGRWETHDGRRVRRVGQGDRPLLPERLGSPAIADADGPAQ